MRAVCVRWFPRPPPEPVTAVSVGIEKAVYDVVGEVGIYAMTGREARPAVRRRWIECLMGMRRGSGVYKSGYGAGAADVPLERRLV